MSLLENTKKKFAAIGLEKLLNLSAHVSDENLIKLIDFAEKIARMGKKEDDVIRALDSARQGIKQGHPWVKLGKRIIRDSASNYKKLAINFFLNSIIWSTSKRREIEEKEGFLPPYSIVISPSMKCNLHCRGCYAWQYSKEEELSLELMDRIITEGKEYQKYH